MLTIASNLFLFNIVKTLLVVLTADIKLISKLLAHSLSLDFINLVLEIASPILLIKKFTLPCIFLIFFINSLILFSFKFLIW